MEAAIATTLTIENREYIPSAWEVVPCPFCGSSESRAHERYGPENRYTYVQCRGCDLVYGSPRPRYDAEFIEAAYSEYDTTSHHLLNGGKLDAGERRLVDRYKISLRQIAGVMGRKGRILDVGCATGLFLYSAREEGWDVVGIDISKSMTEAATRNFGISTHCGQFHELDLAAYGKFDVIYSSHVIEHIPNPNEWMAKFYQELKPDGVLCLNIPNQFSIDRRLKRGIKRIGLSQENWAKWRTPDHLYEPHLKPMQFLLEKHGFRIRQALTYSSREKETQSVLDRWMHHQLKVGSKLRILAAKAPSLS